MGIFGYILIALLVGIIATIVYQSFVASKPRVGPVGNFNEEVRRETARKQLLSEIRTVFSGAEKKDALSYIESNKQRIDEAMGNYDFRKAYLKLYRQYIEEKE